jgi:hypothetical protein
MLRTNAGACTSPVLERVSQVGLRVPPVVLFGDHGSSSVQAGASKTSAHRLKLLIRSMIPSP